jgi:hypothetical protein
MNHKNTTLAIAAIVAAVALSAVSFAIPQQVSAYRHHQNHNGNSIKVDQQTSQTNVCTGVNEEAGESPTLSEKESAEPAPAPTVCLNSADNSADIHG